MRLCNFKHGVQHFVDVERVLWRNLFILQRAEERRQVTWRDLIDSRAAKLWFDVMSVHRAVAVDGRVSNRCGFQVCLPRGSLELVQSNRPHHCAGVVVKRIDAGESLVENSLRLLLTLAIGQGLSL